MGLSSAALDDRPGPGGSEGNTAQRVASCRPGIVFAQRDEQQSASAVEEEEIIYSGPTGPPIAIIKKFMLA